MEALTALLEELGLEPGALLVNIVGFLLLLYLLRRFAFGPVSEFMQQRAAGIEHDLRQAREDRDLAAAQRQHLQEQLDAMREEFRSEIAKSTRQARQAIAELHADARAQRQETVAQGEEQLRRAREGMMVEVRREAAHMAVEVAAKIIHDALDEQRQAVLVEAFIDDIDKLAEDAAREQPAN